MSYKYEYVPKSKYMPIKKELIKLLNEVQEDIRKEFTFSFEFIGSSSRNMITCDYSQNVGFDFDIDIIPNDDEENYSAKELRTKIINSFNKFAGKYGYETCQQSSRVFTIKKISRKDSKILHSADFAIIHNSEDEEEYFNQYIHYYKKDNSYEWQDQPSTYYDLPNRIEIIKDCGEWQYVKDLYLEKKNSEDKKSRALFHQTINEVYQYCENNYNI